MVHHPTANNKRNKWYQLPTGWCCSDEVCLYSLFFLLKEINDIANFMH